MGIASGSIPSGVVDLDSTQTLENKAIINTNKLEVKKILNVDVAGYLSSAEDGELFYNIDTGLYFQVKSNAAKEIVDTETIQVLENKSVINVEAIEAKKGTTSELETYAPTAGEGELVFDTTDKKFFGVANNELVPVGGSGVGSPELYEFIDADSINTNKWDVTGLTNATFTLETVNQLAGKKSYKFSNVAGASVGEKVFYDFTLDKDSQGDDFHKNTFVMNYTGTEGAIKLSVFDKNDLTEALYTFDVKDIDKYKRIFSAKNSTELRLQVEVVVAEDADFIFDKIAFYNIAYDTGAVTISETITYTGFSAVHGSYDYEFKTPIVDKGNRLIKRDETGTVTKVTFLESGEFVATLGNQSPNTWVNIYIYDKNDSIRYSAGVNQNAKAPALSGHANKGDYIVVKGGAALTDNALETYFSVTATAQSDKILFESEREQAHNIGKATWGQGNSLYWEHSTANSWGDLVLNGTLGTVSTADAVTVPNNSNLEISFRANTAGYYNLKAYGGMMYSQDGDVVFKLLCSNGEEILGSTLNASGQTCSSIDGNIYIAQEGNYTVKMQGYRAGRVYDDTAYRKDFTIEVTYLPPSTEASAPMMLAVSPQLENDFDVDANSAGVLSNFNGAADWCEFVSESNGDYYFKLNEAIFTSGNFPSIKASAKETNNTFGFFKQTFPNFYIKQRNDAGAAVTGAFLLEAKKRGADRTDRSVAVLGPHEVVKKKTMYVEVDVDNYKWSMTSTTAYTPMNLDRVIGDIGGVSISNDRVTFAKGVYDLEIPIGCKDNSGWIYTEIYNITNSSVQEEFSKVAYAAVNSLSWNTVRLSMKIDNTSTFEIRTKADNSTGTAYIGRIRIDKVL